MQAIEKGLGAPPPQESLHFLCSVTRGPSKWDLRCGHLGHTMHLFVCFYTLLPMPYVIPGHITTSCCLCFKTLSPSHSWKHCRLTDTCCSSFRRININLTNHWWASEFPPPETNFSPLLTVSCWGWHPFPHCPHVGWHGEPATTHHPRHWWHGGCPRTWSWALGWGGRCPLTSHSQTVPC